MSLTESEKHMLDILRSEPDLTDLQLSGRLGRSRRTVSDMLAKLSDLKKVKVTRIRYRIGASWINLRTVEVKENS